ncbi:MAG: S41 family peptidase [Anaerolineales bacterium]|nr:S41 family peptidase [Anaerolineales bacterium]
MRSRLFISTLILASLACQTVMTPLRGSSTVTPTPLLALPPLKPTPRPTRISTTPLPPPTVQVEVTVQAPLPTLEPPTFNEHGVRLCAYVPGQSVTAEMPPDVVATPFLGPFPTPTPPPTTVVDAETTERQLRIYRQLWRTVDENYVYADFRGRDWRAIGDKYEAYIRTGLSDEDFYRAMSNMIGELGDEHSSFLSPEQVKEEEARLAGNNNYVGVGVMLSAVPQADRAVIITVFPGSPAAEAGLRSHDAILKVNGEPILDENGELKTGKVRGPEGTQVTLTLQRPGGEPFDLTLTRRRITGALPIDYCLVPGTRIGYVFFPSFDDETIPNQLREALEKMTADGPLDGLILDNRQNGGGSSSVAHPILEMFTGGLQGYFVSRRDRQPLELEPVDVNGSQSVPLVVLVDVDTVSYGEIVSGVLRVSGRAIIVGQTTFGNVERLWSYDFEDGSRAWIASETFEPPGETNGIWEETGIVPDYSVPTRWDLFTEATDPALAKAVELLLRP